MLTETEHPIGRFRYAFLDQIRANLGQQYLLVDAAIDVVGSHLHPHEYPKRLIDFSDCGNVAWPKKYEEKHPKKTSGQWRVRHVSKTKPYSINAPEFKLAKGRARKPKSAKAIQAFRKSAWADISRFIAQRRVYPLYLQPNDNIHPFTAEQLKAIHNGGSLVPNVGALWLPTEGKSSILVLLLIDRIELEAAIRLALNDPKTQKSDAAKSRPSKEQTANYLGHIAIHCMSKKLRISRDGAKKVVVELLSEGFKKPSGKCWDEAWKEVKATAGGEWFCVDGNEGGQHSCVGPKGSKAEEFAKELREALGSKIEQRPKFGKAASNT